jgi:DNA-binding response OmpR family regulator
MSETAKSVDARRSVLVVEDEPEVCALLSDMLEAEGYDPVCVQHDEPAFEALRSGAPFACMIVDVNLGLGATGYDVARFARRIASALPIIYVSGQTSPESFAANSVPGSLYLPKPFTAAELMERVRMLIGDNDDEA